MSDYVKAGFKINPAKIEELIGAITESESELTKADEAWHKAIAKAAESGFNANVDRHIGWHNAITAVIKACGVNYAELSKLANGVNMAVAEALNQLGTIESPSDSITNLIGILQSLRAVGNVNQPKWSKATALTLFDAPSRRAKYSTYETTDANGSGSVDLKRYAKWLRDDAMKRGMVNHGSRASGPRASATPTIVQPTDTVSVSIDDIIKLYANVTDKGMKALELSFDGTEWETGSITPVEVISMIAHLVRFYRDDADAFAALSADAAETIDA